MRPGDYACSAVAVFLHKCFAAVYFLNLFCSDSNSKDSISNFNQFYLFTIIQANLLK